MGSTWEDVDGSKPGQALKEDWEDMLDDDDDESHEQASRDAKLSEEAKQKLLIQKAELNDNLECALDLLGEPSKKPTASKAVSSTSSTIPSISVSTTSKKGPAYSIDAAKPRTKEDFEAFSKALLEKVTLFQDAPNYAMFVDGLIRKLADSLTTNEVRKLASEMQTLLNVKLQKKDPAPSAKAKGAKPSLKFGGSVKTSFEHDYQDYADDYDDTF